MRIENATLYDLVLRALMPDKQRERNPFPVPLSARVTLLKAQRFVLDKAMSAYLVDLGIAAFEANPERAPQIADGARRLARLPHAVTWIEYDETAYKKHKREAYPHIEGLVKDPGLPPTERELRIKRRRVGWLFIQDTDTVFRMSIFYGMDDFVITMPMMFAWSCDDENAPPWRGNASPELPHERQAAFAVGLPNYKTDRAVITEPWPGQRMSSDKELRRSNILSYGSFLRSAWCLLATINDLPTTIGLIRPNKGYIACGRYHKFVDHHTINLHVPAHINLRTLAARTVAIVRRRAHQVRGHWRKDFRKPASAFCEHAWQASAEGMMCSLCKGHRIWIIEHQRGDASLGFVTHDYAVKRGEAA